MCTVVFNTLWIVCITKMFDLFCKRRMLSTNEICCCPSIRDICIYALMNTRRGFRLYSFSESIKEIKDYIIVSNTLKLSFPVIVLYFLSYVCPLFRPLVVAFAYLLQKRIFCISYCCTCLCQMHCSQGLGIIIGCQRIINNGNSIII